MPPLAHDIAGLKRSLQGLVSDKNFQRVSEDPEQTHVPTPREPALYGFDGVKSMLRPDRALGFAGIWRTLYLRVSRFRILLRIDNGSSWTGIF